MFKDDILRGREYRSSQKRGIEEDKEKSLLKLWEISKYLNDDPRILPSGVSIHKLDREIRLKREGSTNAEIQLRAEPGHLVLVSVQRSMNPSLHREEGVCQANIESEIEMNELAYRLGILIEDL